MIRAARSVAMIKVVWLLVMVFTEQYRQTYSRIMPHSSLGYRPPAPQNVQPLGSAPSLAGLT